MCMLTSYIKMLFPYCVLLIIVFAVENNATEIPVEPGIYVVEDRVWHCQVNGSCENISLDDNWADSTATGFHNNELFVLWRSYLYQVYKTNWTGIGQYCAGTFLVQVGTQEGLFTSCSNSGNFAKFFAFKMHPLQMKVFTDLNISSEAAAHVGEKYLMTASENWLLIDTTNEEYMNRSGIGHPTAAVGRTGWDWIYAVYADGNIHSVNPNDGSSFPVTSGGLFIGTRGMAEYNGNIYAIGTNGSFYEYNPCREKLTVQGSMNFEVNKSRMAARSFNLNSIPTQLPEIKICPPPLHCSQDGKWRATRSCDIVLDNSINPKSYRVCQCSGGWEDKVNDADVTKLLQQAQSSPMSALVSLDQQSQQLNSTQRLVALTGIFQRALSSNFVVNEQFVQVALKILSQSIIQPSIDSIGSELLQSLDKVVLHLNIDTSITFDNISLVTQRVLPGTDTPVIGISVDSSSITLPPVLFKESSVFVASFFFRNLSSLLPGRDPISPVLSSVLSCTDCKTSSLSENVTVFFSLPPRTTKNNAQCVFWDFLIDNWNASGCSTHEFENGSVLCSCDHLTHFAIILSPGVELSPVHISVLTTIGQVLVSFSLFFLLLTILTFLLMRALWNMRNYIHVMLCANMFVAQLLFVIGVGQTSNEYVCSVFAVVLHYVFLVVFMWMLMEGVVMYLVLVKVFIRQTVKYMIAFTVISYGAPLLYMAIVTPIGFLVNTNGSDHHYGYYNTTSGDKIACWLRYDTHFIWAFIAPVIIIILANVGFIIMTLVMLYRHFKKQNKKVETSVKYMIKITLTLTVVMGVTWIANVLFFNANLVFLAYIMTIFIAGQGLIIFIVLVPLSEQVRTIYFKWWKIVKTQSSFFTSVKNTSKSAEETKSS